MPVSRTCTKDVLAIDLRVSQGEWLHYTVEVIDGAFGSFALANQHGRILLKAPPGASPHERSWPGGSDNTELPNDLMHTLSLHFSSAKTYRYTVERVSNDAGRNGVVKRCTYTSTDATEYFFDPLRIFTS